MNKLFILGRGYVGTALAEKFPNAGTTTRETFVLQRKETWNPKTLPEQGDHVVWTFPAATSDEEEDLAQELYDLFLRDCKVVIYGTTSSYLPETEWITEECPLDLTQVRTRTEEKLREKGACILHLAGIFGPGRDPLNWYRRGLIQHGLSYLNLIDRDDIVSVTEKLLLSEHIQGQRFNLSNGKPKTHLQIVEALKLQGLLPPEFQLEPTRKPGSRIVDNRKILEFLQLRADGFLDYPEPGR